MTTPEQIRAARALKGLSQADLADLTGKTTKTIRRAETTANLVADDTIAAIRAALESAGVIFLDPNGEGAGVRLRKE
jgi:transcriptional regulator with XRE-family HTH domain